MFVFALTGILRGALDETGRSKIDRLIRKYNANFPSNSLVFDFFVNPGLKVGFQIKIQVIQKFLYQLLILLEIKF